MWKSCRPLFFGSFVAVCLVYAESQERCRDPPMVDNAIFVLVNEANNYEIGAKIEYSCDFGYVASDYHRVVTCVYKNDSNTAEWTAPSFICQPRSCGDPGFVSHARRSGSVFTFPNKVTFTCDNGYQIIGSPQRFCQTNGQWSAILPMCKLIKCEIPDNPSNGRAVYESLEFGSEVLYICDRGFTLKNNGKRICSKDGLWSGRISQCIQGECEFPSAPVHGTMSRFGEKMVAGSIVIYSCNDGYRLVGSQTSKCLHTGEWNFPTPQCLTPCVVPNVQRGVIGFYRTSYRNQQRFQQIKAGAAIEDDKKLYLRCNSKYEAADQGRSEVSLSCLYNQWTPDPVCIPVPCRGNPPEVSNAQLVTKENKHGTSLLYSCNPGFKKTVVGNTVCDYGVWKGKLPFCKDVRCSLKNLNMTGLKHGSKELFLNQEVFIPECVKGYVLAQPNYKLVCVDSTWKGELSPCVPSSCPQSPEAPKNGEMNLPHPINHGSVAYFTCHVGYIINSPPLKCLFGEWTEGSCKDVRCYVKDLHIKDGIDISDPNPTLPGNSAVQFRCLDGFKLKMNKPVCSNGYWTLQNNVSPCQPNSCIVHSIKNGEFRYRRTYSVRRDFSQEIVTNYVKEAINSEYTHGSEIYVFCLKPYIFGGKDSATVKVLCSFGEWNPLPQCLLHGMTISTEFIPNSSSVSNLLQSSSVIEVTSPLPQTTNDHQRNKDRLKIDIIPTTMTTDLNTTEKELKEDICYCTYNLDDPNVWASLGTEQLQFGSKVQRGSRIKFSCKNIGSQRLVGVSDLICENCNWHSTQFPSCVEPQQGDPLVFVVSKQENTISVTLDGIFIVPAGINLNVSCIIMDSREWPLFVNTNIDLPIYNKFYILNGQYEFQSDVVIAEADPKYSGKYECISNQRRSTSIQISIRELECPEIVLTDDALLVSYSHIERKVNTKAQFDCSNKTTVLEGHREITCLASGSWSNGLPICRYIECQNITVSNNLFIWYSNEQHVGSTAQFQCGKPFALKGSKSSVCLAGGVWSEHIPECQYVSCSLTALKKQLPKDVILSELEMSAEDFPYGTILSLECKETELRALGLAKANCSEDGVWIVGDFICASGCSAIVKSDNELIIDPTKEFYSFGELVTYSCPPGLVLNINLERAMCLPNGWSKEIVPLCVVP